MDTILTDEKEIIQKLSFLDINLKKENIFICKVSVDVKRDQSIFIQEKQLILSNYIKNYFNRELKDKVRVVFFIGKSLEIVGICNSENSLYLLNNIQRVTKKIKEEENINLLVGISNKCDNISEIDKFTYQAELALYQLTFFEENNINLYENLKDIKQHYFLNQFNTDKVINELLAQDENKKINDIERFFDKFNEKQ